MTRHTPFLSTLLALVMGASILLTPLAAQAGCGCDKPPPAPAAVRPNVTYGGMPITLFSSSLQLGVTYDVTFTSLSGSTITTSAQVVNRRDLANGVYKNQLVVTVPNTLAIGPASIRVTQADQTGALLSIPDTSFTVAPQPLAIPSQVGTFSYSNYTAAVGRNGVTYVSLDVTGITQPRTFQAQAVGWPLRFTKDSTVFYNTQGFLMQLASAPIPGLFSIDSGNSTDSDIAQYSRHEFNTYFLQHAEHLPHATDPLDGNWHLDGSRHVDHNHLILAISGTVNGTVPAPGATPAFTLALELKTFFDNGLVGTSSVSMSGTTRTDSYTAPTGLFGAEGDVLSNGTISMSSVATINGDATAAAFNLSGSSRIMGAMITATQPVQFIPVAVPKGLTDIGTLSASGGQTKTLGPGSYKVVDLTVKDAQLFINNTAGPVTLYVTGAVSVSGVGGISVADLDPEKFAVYVASTKPVSISKDGIFAGVVYAPQSTVSLSGTGEFWGSFIGNQMKLSGSSLVHYNMSLRGQ